MMKAAAEWKRKTNRQSLTSGLKYFRCCTLHKQSNWVCPGKTRSKLTHTHTQQDTHKHTNTRIHTHTHTHTYTQTCTRIHKHQKKHTCESPSKIAFRPARLDSGSVILFFSRLIVAPLSTYPQKSAPGIRSTSWGSIWASYKMGCAYVSNL